MKKEKIIIGYGEVTGHTHRYEEVAGSFSGNKLLLKERGTLIHEEHKAQIHPSPVYVPEAPTETKPFEFEIGTVEEWSELDQRAREVRD